MNRKIKLSFVVLLSVYLFGCFNGTSNSTPQFSGDYEKVRDEVMRLSNSVSVDFVDMVTKNWNNKVVDRELRIDLVKPAQFPSDKNIRAIISAVRAKLIDSAEFIRYTVNEVEGQHGQVIVFPAENILKTVTINAEDL